MTLPALMRQAAAAVAAGDLARAEPLLLQVVGLNPRDAEAWHMLAAIALRAGRPADAMENAMRAHGLDRRNPFYLNTLGVAHGEAGELEEAVRWLRRALKERPAYAEAHYNLGKALHKLGNRDDAERAYQRARQIDPARSDVANNLAVLYCREGRYADALPLFTEALERTPDDETVAVNRSTAQLALSGPQAAVSALESFVARHPQAPAVRAALGRRLLAQGRFAEGWREYAWRQPRAGPPPLFDGQRVLLVPEQGIGDHLFFLRFAAGLRPRAAHVAFACPIPLVPLLDGAGVVDELREAAPFDVAVKLGDLPLLLGETGTPAPVRLNAGPADEWRTRLASLGPPPYLGVTWRGGTKRIAEREFAAAGEIPLFKEIDTDALARALRNWRGTVLVLQRRPVPGEVDGFAKALGRKAHDWSALNESLADMSAVLSLIDEYVGVSNTNMHIRAGVGRSARVLIPFPAEFRWMDEGDRSPWFPGFSLYRQPPSRGWVEVVAKLERDLSH